MIGLLIGLWLVGAAVLAGVYLWQNRYRLFVKFMVWRIGRKLKK